MEELWATAEQEKEVGKEPVFLCDGPTQIGAPGVRAPGGQEEAGGYRPQIQSSSPTGCGTLGRSVHLSDPWLPLCCPITGLLWRSGGNR